MRVLSLTLLALLPALAFALASDRDQPIHIQADNAVVDEVRGTSIYRGKVNIRQGTLRIDADEVELISDNNEVIQIIASMNETSEGLAHYEQMTEDSPDPVLADAKRITYLVQEDKIHLAGEASLKQMKDVFEGELLFYDLAKGVVNLNSSGKPNDRINMTINPRAKKAQ